VKESEHPSTLETPSPSTSRTATVKETLFLPSHPYLSRKVDVVDDVDCWKIGWALVDAKPEGLLDTLHTLNIFYCSKRQKDKTQVKQLRQSSPLHIFQNTQLNIIIFNYTNFELFIVFFICIILLKVKETIPFANKFIINHTHH
jgi:hypothetical protein